MSRVIPAAGVALLLIGIRVGLAGPAPVDRPESWDHKLTDGLAFISGCESGLAVAVCGTGIDYTHPPLGGVHHQCELGRGGVRCGFGHYYPCVNAATCAPKIAGGCATGYYADDTTAADKVRSFSDVAAFLNVLGPGNSCYTLDMVGASGYVAGDDYTSFGGTSTARPSVAGHGRRRNGHEGGHHEAAGVPRAGHSEHGVYRTTTTTTIPSTTTAPTRSAAGPKPVQRAGTWC